MIGSTGNRLDHIDVSTARDMGVELADKFVGMYVNQWTLDYGQRGRDAVQQLLTEGAEAGIVPQVPGGVVDFVDPA